MELMPSPELADNLLTTIYSTFDHNKIVIAYVCAALLGGFLVFKKPTRYHVLLLFGFAILAFTYEYEKHIIAPLRDQTLQAVAPDPNVHVRTQKYLDIFLSVLFPIGLYVTGWGLIFWAMILGGKNRQKNSSI